MKKLEKNLKALANISRLKILQYLKKNKEDSVTNIAEGTKCSYKATSKHLSILFQADIVDRHQVVYEMHYRLAENLDSTVQAILKQLL